MVMSPENDVLKEKVVAASLKQLLATIDQKRELALTTEEINSLVHVVQALESL